MRRGFTKIRILRRCKTCNKIEDEERFTLECTINIKLRIDLFAIRSFIKNVLVRSYIFDKYKS
jgi:hypothetical protein